MKNKIFISYAYQDNNEINKLKSALTEKGIISDEADLMVDSQMPLVPGSSLRGAIRSAMESASTVVVYWTKNSASSDFVNYEMGMADALDKKVVVVTPKGEKLDLPSNIADIQVLELDIEG
ncbi:MAG: toll/interleukin-1 receptor domain-containing protein [Chlorobium sp.]|nr:MAG: toll/interleukin-1 receptor domain-containing protein [Chlorobium sp.]